MKFNFRKKKSEDKSIGLIVDENPTSVISEQFRTIRTNIKFSMVDKELRTLSVTSAGPSSGKSTVASNIATAFAQEGKKVLLVDSDMRKPTVHRIFRVPNKRGLTNYLTNSNVTVDQIINKSQVEGLDFITCGAIPPNPSEILASKKMDEFAVEMLELYDLVIYDTPPILAVTDAQILAAKSDGVIFVVPVNQVKKEEIISSAELLENVKANVFGFVLNKVENSEDNYYYYYGNE